MLARDVDQHGQGQMFLEGRGVLFPSEASQIGGGMLMIISHLRADQDNKPADVEPDEEQNQNGKTGIDGTVARRSGNERRKQHPDDFPQDPARHSTYQG